jgi:ABC-type Fe3+/spermidine/putrescine transport system ATPase subunit
MARVDLKNIVGRYGDFLAVDNVNLTIESGQFVTLLGPSGCGKSSTLRIVAGLLQPSSGQVEFDGRDVTNLAAAKRNIGMVFQSLALFPHMTVAENVAFGLKMKRVPAEESGSWRSCGWIIWRIVTPRRCPAASSSALRLPGRWSSNPAS